MGEELYLWGHPGVYCLNPYKAPSPYQALDPSKMEVKVSIVSEPGEKPLGWSPASARTCERHRVHTAGSDAPGPLSATLYVWGRARRASGYACPAEILRRSQGRKGAGTEISYWLTKPKIDNLTLKWQTNQQDIGKKKYFTLSAIFSSC